ncbi:MAG: hypothetical protein LDL51_08710 [Chloroflexi bacterium]|nr:hypothetical protein [Chloroflexota bacterium]
MPRNGKKKTNEKKGIDTAIIVAIIGLVGTLTVGILNSQVIIKLLDRSSATPAETALSASDAQLIFDENFEDNIASGFAFEVGTWEIVNENSNLALKGVATESIAPAAKAYFGSNDFSDGVVEFRVKFLQPQGLYMDFRFDETRGTYLFNLSPEYQTIVLGTNTLIDGDWIFAAISDNSVRSFTFQRNVWYKIKLNLQGEDLILTIDGNRVLAASDPRFKRGRLRFALDAGAVVELDDIKVWSTTP